MNATMRHLAIAGMVNKARHRGAVEREGQHSDDRDQIPKHERNTDSETPKRISCAGEPHRGAQVPAMIFPASWRIDANGVACVRQTVRF
jgi:hypothetical protein